MLGLGSVRLGASSGAGVLTPSFKGSFSSATDLTTYSASINVGAADPNSLIIVAGFGLGLNTTSGATCTVDAAAATLIVEGQDADLDTYIFAVTGGAITGSVTVAVTHSAGKNRGGFGVYGIAGTSSVTKDSSASDTANNANALSAAITVPTNGVAIAVAAMAALDTPAWVVNFTQDFNVAPESKTCTGAANTTEGADTADPGFTSTEIKAALLVAAWGP